MANPPILFNGGRPRPAGDIWWWWWMAWKVFLHDLFYLELPNHLVWTYYNLRTMLWLAIIEMDNWYSFCTTHPTDLERWVCLYLSEFQNNKFTIKLAITESLLPSQITASPLPRRELACFNERYFSSRQKLSKTSWVGTFPAKNGLGNIHWPVNILKYGYEITVK